MAEQMFELIEDMETLKKDTKGAFMQLAKDIEHELGTMREESKACSKVALNAIDGIYKKLEKLNVSKEHQLPSSVPPSASSTSSKPPMAPPQVAKPPQPSQAPASPKFFASASTPV